MNLDVFNTTSFLTTAGYFGLFLIIYAETGVLVGLVLPGESLLFSAGLLSSLGYFNIWIIILITFAAAVLADSTGYAFGRKYGNKIFHKNNSVFFDRRYVKKAEDFYGQHGGKTIIMARFLPFVRTLAPILAGIGKMRYSLFLFYNLAGALLWAIGISFLGYYLGKTIPNASRFVFVFAILIVLISTAPTFIALTRGKEKRGKIKVF
jgi:membrane-associated protein